ncbi:hypothetical protein [Hydromonas duriensis]|uniref:Uncharacterized protein n=1 Tax=Hydromonas duriensis TaxID=1527608 RepID=A0A4R6Y3Z9_9BURK|nr:hypothetical protein [Hydromonas duriensis]TDR27804.1 hypothetical protein DFR44_1388 [Hydromonas duriensis]
MLKNSNNTEIEFPEVYPHHLYHKLKSSEKFIISYAYFANWRRLVKNKKLKKNERKYFEYYFKEIHAHYYLKVLRGSNYVAVYRQIFNFLLSKANENIRTILASLTPYNATSFVNAMRSQIETNALLHKFNSDTEYHKTFLGLNEDRSKKTDDTVTNINTLVTKLDKDCSYIPYGSTYHDLSLLLHPNPSGIKFYAQATRDEQTKLHSTKISFFFDKTIESTKDYDEWFNGHIWLFFCIIEHFLILIGSLNNEFFFNDQEMEEAYSFAMAELVKTNKKELIDTFNDAVKNNSDVEKMVNDKISSILKNNNT